MATKLISELTALGATPAATDLVEIETAGGLPRKATYAELVPLEDVTDLDALAVAPAAGDLIVIRDVSDLADGADGTDKKISMATLLTRNITVVIGDGTNAITAGTTAEVKAEYGGTITQATLVSRDVAGAAVSGSIVLDIWKDTYANWPPTVADTITASAKPTLSSASKAQNTTLTGWTTTITAGDHLVFVVDSVTTCKQVVLTLKVTHAGA